MGCELQIDCPLDDINASNLSIAENSAIGTVLGEFNATDPDGDGNFTFSLLGKNLGWKETHLTGDHNSEISSEFSYTTAVNFNGNDIDIGGIRFVGTSANQTIGKGWIITQGFSNFTVDEFG